MALVGDFDRLLKKYTGLGLFGIAGLVALFAAAGVAIGMAFPKYHASALLQFPDPPRQPDARNSERSNSVDLAAYKKVAASYGSGAQLNAYLEAAGLAQSPAAVRLLALAALPRYWDEVATPVLPFTRRDQREFGDVRDASANVLLGLELITDARTAQTADQMINILAGYFSNAVVRERIRSWVQTGTAETVGAAKGLQADLVRAELDIRLLERRAQDMKQILSRYPDASRMDARQLISVNAPDGGERFLSPLAQLVGFESGISQRRELMRRWERDLLQKRLLAGFFTEAAQRVDEMPDVGKLLEVLREIGGKTLAAGDASQEWVREATLRVQGSLDNFTVMQTQFGLRNGVRIGPSANRSPVRLAVLLALVAVAALATIAFLRAALRPTLREPLR